MDIAGFALDNGERFIKVRKMIDDVRIPYPHLAHAI